jgi:hypothetical protein
MPHARLCHSREVDPTSGGYLSTQTKFGSPFFGLGCDMVVARAAARRYWKTPPILCFTLTPSLRNFYHIMRGTGEELRLPVLYHRGNISSPPRLPPN